MEAPEQENSRLTGVARPTPTPARYPSPDESLWRSFRRVPRFVWLLASALTLVFASLFWMLRLQSWRSPGEVGYEHQSDSTRSWWFAPVVFGEARSLPDISGRINGIAIQNTGKTSRIWIVAPGGYLAYSDDDGYCWVPYKYDPASGQFRPPANNPCPSQQSTDVLHWPELVPRAYAASEAAGPAIDVRPRQITFRAVELSPVQRSSPKTQSQSVVVTNNSRSIVQVSTKGFEGDSLGEFDAVSKCPPKGLSPKDSCEVIIAVAQKNTNSKRVLLYVFSGSTSPIPVGVEVIGSSNLPAQSNAAANAAARPIASSGNTTPEPKKKDVPQGRPSDSTTSARNEPKATNLPEKFQPPAAAPDLKTTPEPKKKDVPQGRPSDSKTSVGNQPKAINPPEKFQPPAAAPDLLAIEFAGENIGRIIGASGTLWATKDGGRTWTLDPQPAGTAVSVANVPWQLNSGGKGTWANQTAIQPSSSTQPYIEIGKKLEQVQQKLISKGSPLLARSWWGAITSMGYRGVVAGWQRLWQRASAVIVKYGRQLLWALAVGLVGIDSGPNLTPDGLLAWSKTLWQGLRHLSWHVVGQHALLFAGLGCLLLALIATFVIPSFLYTWLRGTLEGLIAIEAEVSTISEYFLRVNPYFNYAFQLENCCFVVLDTGPDCLTAQGFWDDGGKKVRNISVNDNILGGSPDTMGFYPANEYYPYSQISWLEKVLSCIREQKEQNAGQPQTRRIFVGLHAPAANLSQKKRKQAEQQLERNGAEKKPYVLMEEAPLGGYDKLDGYDIRYGTVNHYLSQFFYLCLGCREGEQNKFTGPGVDAVFAGHAHWNMEFQLRKPEGAGPKWSPEVLYGKFSDQVEATCHDPNARWGPLLLQTAACGPLGAIETEIPPNFRYVTVDQNGAVCNLRPRILPPEFRVAKAAAGTAASAQSRSAARQP